MTRLHRDSGASSSRLEFDDDDAPVSAHHEGETGQILASALRSVDKDSEAERALVAVMEMLANKHSNGGDDGGSPITRAFIAKLAAFGFTLLTLVQPTIEQVASRMISPSSALERKLDETIASQATLQQHQQDMNAVIISLAKWVVECELARQSGRRMPDPPAAVRLILVEDELTRSSGR